MLAISNKQINSIFERIVKDKNGNLVRVRFTIIENNGIFQGKIVSIEPLITKESKILCLSCENKNKIIDQVPSPFFKSIISPFVSLEFYMSQPTRAPSYAKASAGKPAFVN